MDIAGTCDQCGWIDLFWSGDRWMCRSCASDQVTVPPPGSPEAVVHGCQCDEEVNNEGRIQPEKGWVRFAHCPIHDRGDVTDE